MKNKNLVFFGIAFLVVFLDQLTKFIAKSFLSISQSVPVLENIFHFTLIKNFGIGFGLLNTASARWILVFITLIIIGVILYYYEKIPKNHLPVISTALVLGGAIGNLIDRILLGFVVDFIDFRFWPAFNIADSAVTIGVIGLLLFFIKQKK